MNKRKTMKEKCDCLLFFIFVDLFDSLSNGKLLDLFSKRNIFLFGFVSMLGKNYACCMHDSNSNVYLECYEHDGWLSSGILKNGLTLVKLVYFSTKQKITNEFSDFMEIFYWEQYISTEKGLNSFHFLTT